jgi:hypothetical protein
MNEKNAIARKVDDDVLLSEPADPELRALEVCVVALLRIDPEARARVLEYVTKRFEEDA